MYTMYMYMYTFFYRFLARMSSYFEFVFFSILLRVVEGIGSAGYITASFTIATILFPTKTGTVIVRKEVHVCLFD